MAICLAKNLTKAVFRGISVTANANQIKDFITGFTDELYHKKLLIFGDNIGGADVQFLKAKVLNISGARLSIGDLAGNPLNAQITASDLLMFAGEFIATADIKNEGQHFRNFFPNVPECRSYQIAVWMKGANSVGNILSCDLFGSVYSSSRAQ